MCSSLYFHTAPLSIYKSPFSAPVYILKKNFRPQCSSLYLSFTSSPITCSTFIFTAKKNEICSFFICPCFVRPSLVNKHFHDNKKTVPQVTNILGVSLFFSKCRQTRTNPFVKKNRGTPNIIFIFHLTLIRTNQGRSPI